MKDDITPQGAKLLLLSVAKGAVQNAKDLLNDDRIASKITISARDKVTLETARIAYLAELESAIIYQKRIMK